MLTSPRSLRFDTKVGLLVRSVYDPENVEYEVESILPSAFKNSDDDPPDFLKLPASNCPEEEFNLKLFTVLGSKSPVATVENKGKHSVSVLSSATAIDVDPSNTGNASTH